MYRVVEPVCMANMIRSKILEAYLSRSQIQGNLGSNINTIQSSGIFVGKGERRSESERKEISSITKAVLEEVGLPYTSFRRHTEKTSGVLYVPVGPREKIHLQNEFGIDALCLPEILKCDEVPDPIVEKGIDSYRQYRDFVANEIGKIEAFIRQVNLG